MGLLKVAYQGEPGAFSWIAAGYVVPEAEYLGFGSFDGVYESVQGGEADLAVLPIENTLIGSIFEVYDLLFEHDGFEVIGEVSLRIDHNLLARKGQNTGGNSREDGLRNGLREIERVYSHAKALAQCKKFFVDHPWMRPVVAEDTAGAAAGVASGEGGKQGVGVIASLAAAKLYGLEVVEAKIQTNRENFTRFVVVKRTIYQREYKIRVGLGERFDGLGPQGFKSGGGWKTSLVFAASHKPGSLLKCLQPFARKGLNLTKIESRPLVGKPWEYLFYLDFEHTDMNGQVERVIEEIRPYTQILRVLGTYGKGVTICESGGGVGVVSCEQSE